MSALQIDGDNVVLCVRSEFLTLKKRLLLRYEYNIREAKHASKIGYLMSSSKHTRIYSKDLRISEL